MRRRDFMLASAAAPLLRAEEFLPADPAPAVPVRGVTRLFVSEVEDKPWFYDREMWPAYLDMLAASGFNRFQLAVGIGYDFLRQVTDSYLVFAYPFLLDVPGYKVRAGALPDAERDRNLETLRFISEQATNRGLHFQLGLWMHGYVWENSPNANYVITGLDASSHAPYCHDALAALLKACPAIAGVTLRIHGESGVAEGSYDFWKSVFGGAAASGRKVELDLHAKGIDQQMIDTALATGLPVSVSPKFWAEHMGMPYLQAAIREQEMPRGEARGLMALSTGTRSFTRYSYADLLRADRRYRVIHRIWPGTQRLLVWGDPVFAAGYARIFTTAGSSGVDLMEPLSFKGRRGSGKPGGRCAYADASLAPRWDWQKYLRTYKVWGAALKNSEVRQTVEGVELALEPASRILPIVTTAYGPSAANNTYWPEIYTAQPIVDPSKNNPYTDTPSPRTFGNASPFDPQLFAGVNEFAAELLKGERSGKYSPIEVAQWLEDLAQAATTQLRQADAAASATADARRIAIDVEIQAALGRFFAARFRAGVLYAIHLQSGDASALNEALAFYRRARETWAAMAAKARPVYVADITFGEQPWLRGHWTDRLAGIDADLDAMTKQSASLAKPAPAPSDARVKAAIAAAVGKPQRGSIACTHTPQDHLPSSEALYLELKAPQSAIARLWYRHLNQAERWQSHEMLPLPDSDRYRASVPADYCNSTYPVQYYFEVRQGPDKAWLYPGFDATLSNQPYFVVQPL